MCKHCLGISLFVFGSLHAQISSKSPNIFDNIQLFIRPAYTLYQLQFNAQRIDRAIYVQQPVSGRINFPNQHLASVETGLTGFRWTARYQFDTNIRINQWAGEIRWQSGAAFNQLNNTLSRHTFSIAYQFAERFQLGLRFQQSVHSLDGTQFPWDNADQLAVGSAFSSYVKSDLVLLSSHFKQRWKKFEFFIAPNISLWGFVDKNSNYHASFLQHPVSTRKWENVNTLLPISGTPFVIFGLLGMKFMGSKVLPMHVAYAYRVEWLINEYSQIMHGLRIQLGIPF